MFWLILLMVFVRLSCIEKVFARKFVYQSFAVYEQALTLGTYSYLLGRSCFAELRK